MIQTDNAHQPGRAVDDYDRRVGENVHSALTESGLSVNTAAQDTGIAYATLHRKIRGLASFNVAELRRLADKTTRQPSDFLPKELVA